MSTVELIPKNDPFCLIEIPSVFTIMKQKITELGSKELGQAYDQTEKVMTRMKNYATRPSVLPFLTSIAEKSLG